MSVRPVLGVVMVFAVVVLLGSQQAEAQEPKRDTWQHSAGSFVKQKGKMWQEHDKDGKVTFRFVETSRNEKYVELYDKTRKSTLRLTDKFANIREDSEVKFSKLYEGGWKN